VKHAWKYDPKRMALLNDAIREEDK